MERRTDPREGEHSSREEDQPNERSGFAHVGIVAWPADVGSGTPGARFRCAGPSGRVTPGGGGGSVPFAHAPLLVSSPAQRFWRLRTGLSGNPVNPVNPVTRPECPVFSGVCADRIADRIGVLRPGGWIGAIRGPRRWSLTPCGHTADKDVNRPLWLGILARTVVEWRAYNHLSRPVQTVSPRSYCRGFVRTRKTLFSRPRWLGTTRAMTRCCECSATAP